MSKLKISTEYTSPNHSPRNGTLVDSIVIHSTGGNAKGALAWLCNPASDVSAHYLIAKDGTIYKLVPVTRTAWHAGKCPNFPKANMRSIGIEMEQLPNDAWTAEQTEALERLIRILVHSIPTIKYLYGHKEINPRKWDPYHVDMNEWRRKLGLTTP